MLSGFLFGSKFDDFVGLLLQKMKEGGVEIEDADFGEYVDNCVVEMSSTVLDMIQKNRTEPTKPTTKSAPSKPASTKAEKVEKPAVAKSEKCGFVLTRGPNKGNKCGKPSTGGSGFCSAHMSKPSEKSEERVQDSEDDEKNSKTATKSTKCCHVMTKGPRSGEECGTAVKGDGDKCATHAKSVSKPKKDVVPAPKSPTTSEPQPKPKAETEKKSKSESGKVSLRRCKERGLIYHAETGFVFKSADELKVIGRIEIVNKKPSGELRPLTHSDVDEIEQMDSEHKFIIDKTAMPDVEPKHTEDEADIENVLNDMLNGDDEEEEEEEDFFEEE